MPLLAKQLIRESQDLSKEENIKFFENPDDPNCHEINWHQ